MTAWTDVKYRCSSDIIEENHWYQGYAEKDRSAEGEEYWHVSFDICITNLGDLPKVMINATQDILSQAKENSSEAV